MDDATERLIRELELIQTIGHLLQKAGEADAEVGMCGWALEGAGRSRQRVGDTGGAGRGTRRKRNRMTAVPDSLRKADRAPQQAPPRSTVRALLVAGTDTLGRPESAREAKRRAGKPRS